MTWIEQDLRVLSRIHISRELRVFGVKFQTQIFICVKNLTFRNSAWTILDLMSLEPVVSNHAHH